MWETACGAEQGALALITGKLICPREQGFEDSFLPEPLLGQQKLPANGEGQAALIH